jgi:hypothetical protein
MIEIFKKLLKIILMIGIKLISLLIKLKNNLELLLLENKIVKLNNCLSSNKKSLKYQKNKKS